MTPDRRLLLSVIAVGAVLALVAVAGLGLLLAMLP